MTYIKTGDYVKDIADFTEVILLSPNDAEAYYNRGCAYVKMSDYDKAISDFTAAIQINPQDGYLFYARGYSYLQNDDEAKTTGMIYSNIAKRISSYLGLSVKTKAEAEFVQAERLGYHEPVRPEE